MGKNKKLHVFWSGGDNAKYAAMQYAIENDYVTLEMTRKAVYMEQVLKKQHKQLKDLGWTESQIWFEKELPVWEKLSLDFAKSCDNPEIHIFIDVSYKIPKEVDAFKQKSWLNKYYHGWSDSDFQKFRQCFPDGEIPKAFTECNYDRKHSLIHRIEHPEFKSPNKVLIIHYVNK